MATTTSPYGGRVQCILLSTVDGYVVYERFYDQFNDIQKAEIRTSFDDALGSNAVQNGLELTGRFKNGRVVGLCADEIIVFALGTGHCDELVLLELLERVVVVLKDVAKATVLTDLVLFEHYMDVVHVVDDMCKDGVIELLDTLAIQKSIRLKAQTYTSSQMNEKLRGFMKKFASKDIKLSSS